MQLSRQLRLIEPVRTPWLQEQGLGSLAARVRAAVWRAYDFPHSGTLVDIGGDGMLLAFLLQGCDALRGIMVDRPPRAQKARFHLDEEGVLERCQIKEDHPFNPLPAGGDLYILDRVLQRYDDDAEAILLLKNCRRAMSPHSTTIIIEPVVLARNTPWGDVRELVSSGGRERIEAEFRALLRRAGLRCHRILPTQAEVSIIEATRE
ncbi:MAG: hypothetical protein HYZ50_22690 [Deltaproteobacteria bacterium]|nr:hypothetical protein [Deltaproteobacteria bacterium]